MDPHRRHQRAIEKIRAARDAIIRVAAKWQRSGTETAALNQPMIDIQEALAELEALEAARPKVQPTPMLTPPTTTTPHPHPRPLGRPDLPRPPASPEADRR